MKNIIIGILLLCMVAIVFIKSEDCENNYMRLHILANSSREIDENAKYFVKEEINNLLVPILSKMDSKQEVKECLTNKLSWLEIELNKFLILKGYAYGVNLKVNNEFFPTRSYDGYVVDSGFYDALTVELGEAKGDNWWCVIYPPLCLNTSNSIYKSRIKQIIEKFFNKEENI